MRPGTAGIELDRQDKMMRVQSRSAAATCWWPIEK
jgi:hypothetical protein